MCSNLGYYYFGVCELGLNLTWLKVILSICATLIFLRKPVVGPTACVSQLPTSSRKCHVRAFRRVRKAHCSAFLSFCKHSPTSPHALLLSFYPLALEKLHLSSYILTHASKCRGVTSLSSQVTSLSSHTITRTQFIKIKMPTRSSI